MFTEIIGVINVGIEEEKNKPKVKGLFDHIKQITMYQNLSIGIH